MISTIEAKIRYILMAIIIMIVILVLILIVILQLINVPLMI